MQLPQPGAENEQEAAAAPRCPAAAAAPSQPAADEAAAQIRDQSYPWAWDPPGPRQQLALRAAEALPVPRSGAFWWRKGETACVHGPVLWRALIHYLRELRWPPAAAWSGHGATWLELVIDFEVSTGLDVPRKLMRDGRTQTGEPPGHGSIGERMRVFAQAVQRLERLLREPVVPGGASGAARRQRWGWSLGALGMPPKLTPLGVLRRPLLAGGAETERVLRRLGSVRGAAIGNGEGAWRHEQGWLDHARAIYEGVRRGDASRWGAVARL